MATFEIGTGYEQPDWCTAIIECGSSTGTECTEFIDSGAGVTVYHLYNVTGCNYISESSLVVDTRYKDTTEWESWRTYTMGGYEGFTYYQIDINNGIGYELRATYKGITKYYSIVAPCVPDWQCEIPLNGYEEDGCGNRRENIDCVDQCEGVTCPDYCDYGTHVKYVNGICIDGSCVYDIEENSVECGYNPCEGVVCPDICVGTDLYSQKCVDGKCVTDKLIESDSIDCGYIPPQEDTINTYIILGGLGLVGYMMLKIEKNKGN